MEKVLAYIELIRERMENKSVTWIGAAMIALIVLTLVCSPTSITAPGR